MFPATAGIALLVDFVAKNAIPALVAVSPSIMRPESNVLNLAANESLGQIRLCSKNLSLIQLNPGRLLQNVAQALRREHFLVSVLTN